MDGLRAYTFLNVFVAHAADGDLADAELHTIRTNVHRLGRGLGYATQDLETMLHQTLETYWRLLELGNHAVTERVTIETRVLATVFRRDPQLVHAIREDLMQVAGADGEIVAMESFLIDGMTRRWQEAQA